MNLSKRGDFLNRRWLVIVLGVLSLLMVYEVFNNYFSLFMLMIGVVSLLLNSRAPREQSNNLLVVGVVSIVVALFSSRIVLAVLAIGLLILIGENPEIFQVIREVFSNKKNLKKENSFLMVDFEETGQPESRISRNRWIGENSETEDDIYSWEDVNFTKLIGNTVFDLGNTILPKDSNVMLIRKGIGKTKILVPEGVAISLNISMLIGDVRVGGEEVELKNETFHWETENYHENMRKIKLISNVLIGEVEVIFL